MQVKPQVNQSVGIYTDLLLGGNDNIEVLDYDVGLVASIFVTDRCDAYGDNGDYEDQEGDEDGDNESDGDVQADGDVSSFLTLHQLMEN